VPCDFVCEQIFASGVSEEIRKYTSDVHYMHLFYDYIY
jgi:hypothetical protein